MGKIEDYDEEKVRELINKFEPFCVKCNTNTGAVNPNVTMNCPSCGYDIRESAKAQVDIYFDKPYVPDQLKKMMKDGIVDRLYR